MELIMNYRVCVLQPEIFPGRTEENLAAIDKLAGEAAENGGLDLLLLPENFVLWGPNRKRQNNPEVIIEFLRDLARKYRCNLIGGSFHHHHKSGKYLNTCYIFNREGNLLGEYYKRELFHREIEQGVDRGDRSTVVEIEGWRIGVLICADLWYPELCRELLDKTDIIAVPVQSVVRNAAYQVYGRRVWHALAMTRSQENSIIVMAADHPALNRFPYAGGGSSICDPSAAGEESGMANIQLILDEGKAGAITAEVDKTKLEEFRRYRRSRGLLPFKNGD